MSDPSDAPTPVQPPESLLQELAAAQAAEANPYEDPPPADQQPPGDALLTITIDPQPLEETP
ncbi:hypothetical protein [Streptomyces endophyticus]|uniref:Uncharacterized protein n=1 Tax=Streptomyces endophyticus TaxID=714166 RepID=A0ABU6FKN1_9ACTN|nr:hypothetical protein [Streptomyces endophyticus]MEB8344083.1 hypothetical protein [Streptomyces endophyticus]